MRFPSPKISDISLYGRILCDKIEVKINLHNRLNSGQKRWKVFIIESDFMCPTASPVGKCLSLSITISRAIGDNLTSCNLR